MTEPDAEQNAMTLQEVFARLHEREVHLFIGVLQGLAFYGLLENGEWLADHLQIAFPLLLIAIVWPPVFMLSFSRATLSRALAYTSAFVALLATLAAYTGWQATPGDEHASEFLGFTFASSILVSVFVALIHLQPMIKRSDASYEVFFTLSWRNFLTVALSFALVLGVRFVLFLWESLFAVIGVEFFQDLFSETWFILPVLCMSFAFGLYSFRAATSVIDSVSSLLARLTWLLLPILMLLIAAFLAALPFQGLQPLWDTDRGTLILMVSNLFALLLLNAVYQTGERLPYVRPVHMGLMVGVVLLPVICALACYGLFLRVGQYGWTIARLWALLLVALMACFSVGYAYVILRSLGDWHKRLPDINRYMSWVVLGSLLLTASPLLDFRAISAWSQISRYESGAVSEIDLEYLRERLGRPGQRRLEALQASDPGLLERLEARQHVVRGWPPEVLSEIVKRPASMEVPEALSIAVKSYEDEPPKLLIRAYLDDDETHEFVSVWFSGDRLRAVCWTRKSDDDWRQCGVEYLVEEGMSREELLTELLGSEPEVVTPTRPYMDLRFGERRMEFE